MVKKILAAVVVLAVVLWAYSWYKAQKVRTFSFQQGELVEIDRGDLVIPISATGNVEPASRTEIKSKASGTVTRVFFKPGDMVKKGDLLVELDPIDEQRHVDNAQAELKRAQANLAMAKSDAEKIRLNWPALVEMALAELGGARAELSAATAKLTKLEKIRGGSNQQLQQLKKQATTNGFELPQFADHSDPLLKRADAAIRKGKQQAAEADRLARWCQEILDADTGVNPWQALNQLEYQNSVSNVQVGKARVQGLCSKVHEAITNRILIDQAQQKVTLAQQQLKQTQVALKQTTQRLEETKVYAPIDSLVLDVGVQEGQIISSGVTTVTGGTTLMTLADVSEIYVEAHVDEAEIGRVRQLADVMKQDNDPIPEDQLVTSTSDAKITVDAFREDTFTGRISRIYPRPKKVSNVITYKVRILLTSENRDKLMLGMHAGVEFTAIRRQNVLRVDTEAIKFKNDLHGVYIPDEKGDPVFVPVKAGANNGEKIELITDKLEPGQKVFTKLPIKLKDSDQTDE